MIRAIPSIVAGLVFVIDFVTLGMYGGPLAHAAGLSLMQFAAIGAIPVALASFVAMKSLVANEYPWEYEVIEG